MYQIIVAELVTDDATGETLEERKTVTSYAQRPMLIAIEDPTDIQRDMFNKYDKWMRLFYSEYNIISAPSMDGV